MHRRLGLVVAFVLVSLALASKPASASCLGDCINTDSICVHACNRDPDCQSNCADAYEACRCGCGYCP